MFGSRTSLRAVLWFFPTLSNCSRQPYSSVETGQYSRLTLHAKTDSWIALMRNL